MISRSSILKKTNYYIEYNFDYTNQVTVSVSFANTKYSIKYDYIKGVLKSDFNNIEIKCSTYSVPAFVRIILKKICEFYKYPIGYVIYKKNSINTLDFIFELELTEQIKARHEAGVNTIYTWLDIEREGLKKEHIELSREFDFFPELKEVINYQYGINIC